MKLSNCSFYGCNETIPTDSDRFEAHHHYRNRGDDLIEFSIEIPDIGVLRSTRIL